MKFNSKSLVNFKKAPKVSLTPEEQKKVRRAKALIRLLYWDAVTQEEATEKENNNQALGYK